MEEDTSTQDYVAPLQIRKSQPHIEGEDDIKDDHVQSQPEEDDYSPPAKFQSFLRACYPFKPSATPSPSTVTLGLTAGAIILVHSVHTNGWADGTLLETGARGWLPTNYCEAYDYGTMRPLLKALTEFWDIVRSDDESNAVLFHNHDYMRGIVAGVRFLLEKSDCLTRESKWVKQFDKIRRIRKSLLADLSNLVKAAKQLQQVTVNNGGVTAIADILDDMLFKAFRVVTRAVSFFDAWSEEIPSSREIPSDTTMRPQSNRLSHTLEPSPIEAHELPATGSRRSSMNRPQSVRTPSMTRPQSALGSTEDRNPRKRPASVSSRRQTTTHRMSYTGRRSKVPGNCASEQLSATYDAFLGVLASFLGSHMQSRSSSELLLTTQQAVKACRKLMDVVEVIIEHGPQQAETLSEAKDDMQDKIFELVSAAQAVFRPLQSNDDDVIYLPSEGVQLVTAATACVSGAGRCISKARVMLEDVGDFELDLLPISSTESSPVETQNLTQPFNSEAVQHDLTGQDMTKSQRPQLEINTSEVGTNVHDIETAASTFTPLWTPLVEAPDPSPSSIASSTSPPAATTQIITKPTFDRPYIRNVMHSSESQTTIISSVRDSGPSFVSEGSTRATSPDRNIKPTPLSPDPENLNSSSGSSEELDDGEDEILEQTFAHELLFNSEGRVIGGTLDAIVERLTAHHSTPENSFVSTVYLTFRLFAEPVEFAKALFNRFEYIGRTPNIAGPVRLRVYNVLKKWLEAHWRDECDAPALGPIAEFAQNVMLPAVPTAGQRLLELTSTIGETHGPSAPIRVLSATVGKMSSTSASTFYRNPDNHPLPQPILTKTQMQSLKTWKSGGGTSVNIIDFDPTEIARQITIKESMLFCSILPEELLATEFTKQSSSLAINVRAMAQLSTDLANLVADSILQLEEAKKRAAIIKHWIKIAKKCLDIKNYDTLMAIVCSINSSTILRLKKTWDLIGQKTKHNFGELKKVVDVSKNYSILRQRVASHTPPCLPFVGMYLTDLTFTDHGNPATRQLKIGDDEEISVINLDKHMKTAKIISDLQRFQIPYRLTEVSELQTWLQDELVRVRAAGERNFQNHYRRSLVLEPRETTTQTRPTTTMGALSSMAAITNHKDKFDFLAWTHIGRDKTAPVQM